MDLIHFYPSRTYNPVAHESFATISTTRPWNSIDDSIRATYSLGMSVMNLYCLHAINYNSYFHVAIDRCSSILHTRLRLNFFVLNNHLFKINCPFSPVCACGAPSEPVIQYLLYCPQYYSRLLLNHLGIVGAICLMLKNVSFFFLDQMVWHLMIIKTYLK